MKALVAGIATSLILAAVIAVVMYQLNPSSAELRSADSARVGEAAP